MSELMHQLPPPSTNVIVIQLMLSNSTIEPIIACPPSAPRAQAAALRLECLVAAARSAMRIYYDKSLPRVLTGAEALQSRWQGARKQLGQLLLLLKPLSGSHAAAEAPGSP
jgi:hypothetical protein